MTYEELLNAKFIGEGKWFKDSAYQVCVLNGKYVYFQNLYDGGYEAVGEVVPEYPWKAGQMGVDDKEAGVDFIGLKN